MNNKKRTNVGFAVLLTVVIVQILPVTIEAQDTNTLEIIKQLQKRLEELEHSPLQRRIEALEEKVKMLESEKQAAQQASDAKLKQQADALEQKFKDLQQAKDAESKQQAEALNQQVRTLERNRELDKEAAAAAATKSTKVSLGDNGLVVRSGDSNFVMNVHGYIQADGRFYPYDQHTANDTFLLRRVRPIIEGTVYEKFDYRLMTDFGSGNVSSSSAGNNALLDDAYVNARFWPQAQVQVGKFKSPVGLERLQSTAELLFVENGFATQMTPNYDLGAEVHNTLFNTPINYAIGIFNGAADGGSADVDTTDEGKDVVGRLFLQPFLKTDIKPLQKLGFGVGGSVGHHEGPLSTYKTPGQQTFFSYTNGAAANGQQYRIDPQFYYYWGPFGVLGEYIVSSQEVSTSGKTPLTDRFNNRAWQVAASWFLTGDENSFRSTSRHLFHPTHPLGEGIGAFELVGRVEQLSLDRDAFPNFVTKTSAKEANSWGVGLNWYLNSNLRLYLDYESTWFEGGSKTPGTVTARDEHVILARVQVSF
jgi:phosphate-selective porin OprO/OprP